MTAVVVPVDRPPRDFGDSQAVRLVLHTPCPVQGCIAERGTECNPPRPEQVRPRQPFFHVARVARAFEAL